MNKQSNPSKTAASTAAPGIECDTCLKNTYQGPINKNTNPGYKGSNGSGSGNTETQGGTQ